MKSAQKFSPMYEQQVRLLVKVLPEVAKITEFAMHGGTAINLFHRNLPRLSVDIDLTYIPIKSRANSKDMLYNWFCNGPVLSDDMMAVPTLLQDGIEVMQHCSLVAVSHLLLI